MLCLYVEPLETLIMNLFFKFKLSQATLAKLSYSCLFEGVGGGKQGWGVESRGGTWGDKAGIRVGLRLGHPLRGRATPLGLGPPP